jgi:hypothetical protein
LRERFSRCPAARANGDQAYHEIAHGMSEAMISSGCIQPFKTEMYGGTYGGQRTPCFDAGSPTVKIIGSAQRMKRTVMKSDPRDADIDIEPVPLHEQIGEPEAGHDRDKQEV